MVFGYYLDEYCNELELLFILEKKIKHNIDQLAEAYNNPDKPEVLSKYPENHFQTAFGNPQQFLKVRTELYPRDSVHAPAGRFGFFNAPSASSSQGQQEGLYQASNNSIYG